MPSKIKSMKRSINFLKVPAVNKIFTSSEQQLSKNQIDLIKNKLFDDFKITLKNNELILSRASETKPLILDQTLVKETDSFLTYNLIDSSAHQILILKSPPSPELIEHLHLLRRLNHPYL